MYILGIHGGYTINQHDAGACIIHNGEVLAAAEEERYIRNKGAFGKLPIKSIAACLKLSIGMSLPDLFMCQNVQPLQA